MGLCNTTEKVVLNRVFGNDDTWTQPTGSFIALSRANPYDDLSGFDEPTNPEYIRQLVQISGTCQWSIPQPTGGEFGGHVVYNTGEIIFPEATGNWGNISHFVIFNDVSTTDEEDALVWGSLNVAKHVDVGDTAKFPAESLYVRMV